jgi:hypothetical protein
VRRVLAVAGILAIAGSLGGCSLVGSSTPQPTSPSSKPSPLSDLVPAYPKDLTAATAKTVTVRTANAVQGLIAKTDIVTVDDKSELVAATAKAGSFYGVARGVATSSGFDPIAQATAMEKLLVLAGWTAREAKTTTARYAAVLTTATPGGVSVLELQAVARSTNTPAVVLISIESPDLPAK